MISPEELGAALLSSTGDAIIAADEEGIIRFWNPGAERIFAFTAAEAMGRSLDMIIHERLRERHWQGYREVIRTGRSRYGAGDLLAVPGVRKDGTRVSLEFTIAPLRGTDGRMVGLVAVLRDVTARYEELRDLRKKAAER
jgi:PAS domain S-box-containing protein